MQNMMASMFTIECILCNEIIKFVAANDDIEMHTVKEKI